MCVILTLHQGKNLYTLSCTVKTEEDTQLVAKALANVINPPLLIGLEGALGIGKTAFAKAFIHTLLPHVEVTSPTYNLVHVYDSQDYPVWHCDLYRLQSEEEWVELGLEEAWKKAVVLLEWPGLIRAYLPPNHLMVYFHTVEDDDLRHLKLVAQEEYHALLLALEKTLRSYQKGQ